MSYDEFEAMMIEAGWSLDEVEAMWWTHRIDEFDPDPWETEGWDRD